ncbi:glutathione transferase GstA [bacterium]|nr:glutathione transferase GstA [bacterium]
MKLYYVAGACSLSPHILLHELGIKAELERVDLSTKKTASGQDFLKINPKGYVPALQLDSGEVLTEGVAIVSYLGSLKPDFGPKPGTLEFFRQLEWLTFISSEIHKGFGPLFAAASDPEVKAKGFEKLKPRLAFLNQHLQGKDYLLGQFSLADAYLFTTLSWTSYLQIELGGYPAVMAYLERMGQRPGVKAAQEAEKELSPA